MAAPPRFRTISMENYRDAPQWFSVFIQQFNELIGGLVDALNKSLTRSENIVSGEKTDITFKGGDTINIPNSLSAPPRHMWVTRLQRKDTAALSAAYSFTWSVNSKNQIELQLQGLVSGDSYSLSVIYE